jgi:hypothetical protein
MKLALATLPVLALLAGCTAIIPAPERPEEDVDFGSPAEIDQDPTSPSHDASDKPSAANETATDGRAPGDFVTFAFSGSYRKAPLKLTERVIARDADSITIDFAFKDADKTDTLRVKTATTAAHRGEVLGVERVLADGSTKPSTREAFEAHIAETVAVADSNDALLDETVTKITVGKRDLSGTVATYRVKVGDKTATLRTFTADDFQWGDAGGEIKTADGKVFYKAELVDLGGDRRTASLDL